MQRGAWDQIAAALDNDGERLLKVFVEHGFVRADSPPPVDKAAGVVPAELHVVSPAAAVHVHTRVRGSALGQMARMDKDVMRHTTVPKDFVFTNRLFVGLFSVLAALRATADWRRHFRRRLHRAAVHRARPPRG